MSEPIKQTLIESAIVWDEAIAAHSYGHPLQSAAWGAFKARWGWEQLPLKFELPTGQISYALVLKRKLPGLPFSMLYLPKGPVFDYGDDALRTAVLRELEALGRRENGIVIKIDPALVIGRGEDDAVVPDALGVTFQQELLARGWHYSNEQVQFPHTVTLSLVEDEETILGAMKSKTRYNIRLAARKGVTVRQGDASDWPLVAAMYAETAARDGFAIRPEAYYLDAWETFAQAGAAAAFIAEYEGQPLGAVVIIQYGRQAIYMYGASTNLERNRMPNYLLQWEAIRWAKEQGCTVYDFWGAPTEFIEADPLWGVWRFKKGFNGEVVRYLGAWDYPVRPFWYKLYTVLLPKYTAWLRRRAN